MYIISIPTPVNKDKILDLIYLEKASAVVGRVMSADDIDVYMTLGLVKKYQFKMS